MTRRRLTEEEKKLWSKVTRDVQQRSPDLVPAEQEDAIPSGRKPAKKPASHVTPRARPVPQRQEHAPVVAVDHNWQQKLRRGKVSVEGKIDLHGMTQDRAYGVLSGYIHRARASGKRVILVITGKGGPKRDFAGMSMRDFEYRRGVLRDQVPNWLSSGDLRGSVVSFFSANREHGGEGALYVILKKEDK
ncbi:Smr/MutS family protein [Emcibacter sp.]|uniref:Smr/MutS family protein n=1 Tax=Emcibacter sp. TaxID=1979954 RepID=UPI002AA73C50|nr:Smr/MutS family protein [Emcibacter sp.]